jgi:peptide/nickel transport system permease protein
LKHLILPAFVLAMTEIAGWTRYIRGQMLEVIRQDYIRTANAKGLRERVVIFRHALRNALLPLITLFGLTIPTFFSGALITETIFAWPGIGLLTYEAAVARDYPVIMGTVMFSAVLVILGNLLSDIGYSLLDPRIKAA